MDKIITIPKRLYPIGKRSFTLDRMPDNTKGFVIKFSRTDQINSYPTTTVISKVLIECSKDNGKTWHEFFTGGFFGGPILAKDGVTIEPESFFIVTWPWKPVNERKEYQRGTDVRVTINTLQDIETEVTLQSIS